MVMRTLARPILEPVAVIDPLGEEFGFTNGRRKFVMSIAGEGAPPVEYVTTRGADQDGETVRTFHLRPRALIMAIRWIGCTRDEYWSLRAALLNQIRPNRQTASAPVTPFSLRRTLSDRSKRQIDGFFTQGPVFEPRPLDRWDEFGFSETLQFDAHDPLWYDPTQQSAFQQASAGLTDQLVFPITFPIVFGLGVVSGAVSCLYAGTWAEYPQIVIQGPLNGLTLEHQQTGLIIGLDYDIALGEQVTFDLRYGVKTVTSSTGANLIGFVRAGSDLGTFRLEPYPTVPPGVLGGVTYGVNNILYSGDGADGNTVVLVRWYSRFYGI